MAEDNLGKPIISSLKRGRHIVFKAANIEDADNMVDDAIAVLNGVINELSVIEIISEDGLIGIEQVRQLQSKLNTKSQDIERMLVVIKSAIDMSQEAQNYLLKSLEDSGVGKQFILASDYSNKLILTLLSRCDVFSYRPSADFISNKSEQALYAATGFSYAKFKHILEQKQQINDVKAWLASSPLKRMQIVNSTKEQEKALDFINNLQIILTALLQVYIEQNDTIKIEKTADMIDAAEDTAKRIYNSGNTKLNITQLALKI